MSTLTRAQWVRLRSFIGYGSPEAAVWFIGMEEGGGGEENVRSRLRFRRVEDCAEAHDLLGKRQFHTGKRVIQSTWRGMCYVMLRRAGLKTDTESIRNYQANHLGRRGGHAFLCELMPLPKFRLNWWGYQELIPWFKTSDDYYEEVMPFRIRYLRRVLQKYRPRTVICYGKGYWNDYGKLFGEPDFEAKGHFMVWEDSGRRVILAHHFTARTMNGNLEKLVELAKD